MKEVMTVPVLIFVFACLELFIMIEIGQLIGPGPIFGEILLTGIVGVVLLQISFGRAISGMIVQLFAGRFTIRDLLRRRELILLLAGLLFLLPGIISDIGGLVLIGRYLLSRARKVPPPENDVIDVEYEVHDEHRR